MEETELKRSVSSEQIVDEYGDDAMIDRATQCLRALFQLAVCEKRNFIIDQVWIDWILC